LSHTRGAARCLAEELGGALDAQDLELGMFQCYVRMTDVRTGERVPAFSVQLDPPPEANEQVATRLARYAAERSRAATCWMWSWTCKRLMRRFKSAEHAQRFLGPFGAIGDHFQVGRYRTAAATRRQLLVERRSTWLEVVGIHVAA
jgi:hypothetical protein